MLKTVFYVSLKTSPWPDDQADVDAITEVARARNESLEVTGALVSTDSHFAQVLEGPPEAVDAVMTSILADPRHRDVNVLTEGEADKRLFLGWSLAYAGRATYVAGMIAPLLTGSDRLDAGRLYDCIRAFSRSA